MSDTTELVILFIWVALSGCYCAYFLSATCLRLRKRMGLAHRDAMWRIMNVIWLLTRWPCLLCLIANPIFCYATGVGYAPLDWGCDAASAWMWWYTRDLGDDDDWKQLKKQAGKKVKVLGRKLVVVPAIPEPV